MTVLNTTDKNFKNDVLDSSKPVLVDFWAEWCGPCKMLGPILEEISEDLKDKLQVVKVNLDKDVLKEINEIQKKYPNPCP